MNYNQGTKLTEEAIENLIKKMGGDDDEGHGDCLRARMLLENTAGLPKFEQAFELFMKAANKGNTEGMLQVVRIRTLCLPID